MEAEKPLMNHRYFWLAAVAGSVTPAISSPTTIDVIVNEGGNLSVSTPTDHDRMAIDLAGRIWVLDGEDKKAVALTPVTEYNRSPIFSPDGRWIAYESMRNGFLQIMLIEAGGGTPQQVTFGDYNHQSPTWSPDGLGLAMSSDRAGNFNLWALDLGPLSLQQLTFGPGNDREPNWNADGRLLAFVRDEDSGSALLALEPGTEPEVLGREEGQIHAPAWRPGDGVLTYVRQHEGVSQLRMLILSEPPISKPISRGENVFRSPARWIDAQNFFYTADGHIKHRKFGLPMADEVPFEAHFRVGSEQYPVREYSFDDGANQSVNGVRGASYMADGRLIISALGDLWKLDTDGTLLRQLTNDPFVDSQPAMSPDGRTLAFISDRSGNAQIWLMDMESMGRRRLTSETGAVLHPVWNPTSDALGYLVASHPAATTLTLKNIDIDDRRIRVVAGDLANPAPPVWHDEDWSMPSGEQTEALTVLPSIPLTWRPFNPEGRFIIRAGRIFDGIGPDYLIDHEIVVRDNRIEEIRPWSSEDSNERVIDASGHTVIPGLIDLAVRQSFTSDESLGRTWLAFGITTIRETVTDRAEATERRESWRSGRRSGPRLYMTIRLCNEAGAAPNLPELDGMIVDAAAMNSVALIELCPTLSGASQQHLISSAHANGLPIATATPFPGIFLGANEVRLDTGNQQYGRLITRHNGINYGDVLSVAGKLNSTVVSRLGIAGRNRRAASASLFRAINQGTRVVVGSDAPFTPYGLGLHTELQLMAESGLQPFQILRMASLDAARVLGVGDDLGSIEAGKLADLIIIDGDPLKSIDDTANVVITVLNGRPYALNELLRPGSRAQSVGKFYN